VRLCCCFVHCCRQYQLRYWWFGIACVERKFQHSIHIFSVTSCGHLVGYLQHMIYRVQLASSWHAVHNARRTHSQTLSPCFIFAALQV
jgi:hypothetical protein